MTVVSGAAACGSSSTTAARAARAPAAQGRQGRRHDHRADRDGARLPRPGEAYTTQAAEAHWLSYLGAADLQARRRVRRAAQLIPALAEALPQVSADGKTYTLKLRQGLTFSDGKPVKASDFAATVERAIKLNWGGKSFLTSYVKGAAAFDTGKAKSISGITTDDATGEITITLDTAYGAFANVLAFPSLGLVPKGTPAKNLSNNPPPGVGPYTLTDVNTNRGWTLVKNPKFAAFKIPDIPTGHLDKINFKITSNTQTEAQQVLNNQADAFDAGDTLPPALLPQIQAKAQGPLQEADGPVDVLLLPEHALKPFNNELRARPSTTRSTARRCRAWPAAS